MKRILSLVFLAAMMFIAGNLFEARAQIRHTVSFSGYITDTSGNPKINHLVQTCPVDSNIFCIGPSLITYTDSNGYYEFGSSLTYLPENATIQPNTTYTVNPGGYNSPDYIVLTTPTKGRVTGIDFVYINF